MGPAPSAPAGCSQDQINNAFNSGEQNARNKGQPLIDQANNAARDANAARDKANAAAAAAEAARVAAEGARAVAEKAIADRIAAEQELLLKQRELRQ